LTSALAAAVLLGLAGTPVVAQAETTVYRGAFACADGKPLAGARVELWQQHVRWLPRLPPNYVLRNVTRADDNGAWGFTVRGDETNWVVRVVLVGEDAAIQDWPWPWNFFAETLRSQNDRPLRDYGTQAISGYQCDLYTAFTAAGREYRSSVGSAPPQGATLVRAGAPTAASRSRPTTRSGGRRAARRSTARAARRRSTSSRTCSDTSSTATACTSSPTRRPSGTCATTRPNRARRPTRRSPSTRAGRSSGPAR
jgi:hypothetical protein